MLISTHTEVEICSYIKRYYYIRNIDKIEQLRGSQP